MQHTPGPYRFYKIKWKSGVIEDQVQISDDAWYTWNDVDEVLAEY